MANFNYQNLFDEVLAIKLENGELNFAGQRCNVVEYDQQRLIGDYIQVSLPKKKIVEMKVLGGMDTSHLANIIDYLAVSACSIGLLITFGERSLKYKRVFPSETGTKHIINKQLLFVPDWLKDTKD